MHRQNKLIVDHQTGEIESEYVLVATKRRNGFQRGGWLAMSQTALDAIAEIDRLEDMRVLMKLLAKLDFDNYIQVSQIDIATALNMDKSQVSRAMKRLIERGIILKGPKIGRSNTYRLNPHYGWKGSAKSHQKALQEAADKWGKAALTDNELRQKLEAEGQQRLTD
jgi:predicted transcriptional regulator